MLEAKIGQEVESRRVSVDRFEIAVIHLIKQIVWLISVFC